MYRTWKSSIIYTSNTREHQLLCYSLLVFYNFSYLAHVLSNIEGLAINEFHSTIAQIYDEKLLKRKKNRYLYTSIAKYLFH